MTIIVFDTMKMFLIVQEIGAHSHTDLTKIGVHYVYKLIISDNQDNINQWLYISLTDLELNKAIVSTVNYIMLKVNNYVLPNSFISSSADNYYLVKSIWYHMLIILHALQCSHMNRVALHTTCSFKSSR